MRTLYFIIFLVSSFAGNAQNILFPDANFKAKLLETNPFSYVAENIAHQNIAIDANADGEIQQGEADQVAFLSIIDCNISSMEGIQHFANLKRLDCSNNQITALNLSGMPKLETLNCYTNPNLTDLNLDNCNMLKTAICRTNKLEILQVDGLTQLMNLDCSENQLTAINLSDLINIKELKCDANQLGAINTDNLLQLNKLICRDNLLTSLTVNNLPQLIEIDAQNNLIASVSFTNLPQLASLSLSKNELTVLDVNNLQNLNQLYCNENHLTELSIHGLSQFQRLGCLSNQITSLTLHNLPSLVSLNCSHNQLADIAVQEFLNLSYLDCDYNQLTTLDVSGTSMLTLNCGHNLLGSLNVDGLTNIIHIYCAYNQLTALDFSTNSAIQVLQCNDNLLQYLSIKNGGHEPPYGVEFQNNPTLLQICEDMSDYYMVQQRIAFYGYTNCTHGYGACAFLATQDFEQSNNITLYPNPASSILNIESKQTLTKIEIFNTLGQLVLETSEIKNAIDISLLQKGTYFIKVFSDSGNFNSKFIRN